MKFISEFTLIKATSTAKTIQVKSGIPDKMLEGGKPEYPIHLAY